MRIPSPDQHGLLKFPFLLEQTIPTLEARVVVELNRREKIAKRANGAQAVQERLQRGRVPFGAN